MTTEFVSAASTVDPLPTVYPGQRVYIASDPEEIENLRERVDDLSLAVGNLQHDIRLLEGWRDSHRNGKPSSLTIPFGMGERTLTEKDLRQAQQSIGLGIVPSWDDRHLFDALISFVIRTHLNGDA